MNQELPASLIGGGPSFDHWHPADRAPTHDTLAQLQGLNRRRTTTGAYTATDSDDIILASDAGPITLPLSKGGREFEVVMIGTSAVTISLSGADTVCGETSALVEVQWTALRFKSITGGWILI